MCGGSTCSATMRGVRFCDHPSSPPIRGLLVAGGRLGRRPRAVLSGVRHRQLAGLLADQEHDRASARPRLAPPLLDGTKITPELQAWLDELERISMEADAEV